MFRIESKDALTKAFRLRDQRDLELPEKLQFPLFVRDYFTWQPAGNQVYLVFCEPQALQLIGIRFYRVQSSEGSKASLCEWCHAHGPISEIGLLTVELNGRRKVGVNLCLDLRCIEKIESVAHLSSQNSRDLAKRLVRKMSRFAREALEIEPPGRDVRSILIGS